MQTLRSIEGRLLRNTQPWDRPIHVPRQFREFELVHPAPAVQPFRTYWKEHLILWALIVVTITVFVSPKSLISLVILLLSVFAIVLLGSSIGSKVSRLWRNETAAAVGEYLNLHPYVDFRVHHTVLGDNGQRYVYYEGASGVLTSVKLAYGQFEWVDKPGDQMMRVYRTTEFGSTWEFLTESERYRKRHGYMPNIWLVLGGRIELTQAPGDFS